jgi:hypothetical protein
MRNGMGTAGFVLGLVALLLAWIPVVGVIAWPLSIVGAILSGVGLHRISTRCADNKGLAWTGLITSAVALLICIIWLVAFGAAVSNTPSPTRPYESNPTRSPVTAQAGPAVPAQRETVDAGPTFPGKKPDDQVVAAGGTVTFDGVSITSTVLRRGDSTFRRTLCTTVSYRNDGARDASFSMFDFTMQDAKGAIVNPTFFGGGDSLGTGDLAPGGAVHGDVCFEDKANARGAYVVLYEPNMFLSDRGAFVNQR